VLRTIRRDNRVQNVVSTTSHNDEDRHGARKSEQTMCTRRADAQNLALANGTIEESDATDQNLLEGLNDRRLWLLFQDGEVLRRGASVRLL
jgi:hypothetical protein